MNTIFLFMQYKKLYINVLHEHMAHGYPRLFL